MNVLAKLDPRIVTVAQEQAVEALKDEAVARAQTAASQLRGVVIADAAEAARVTDALAVVKDGSKVAKALLDGLTGPLKKATDAARFAFKPVQDALAEAEQHGKAALSGWAVAEQRRAAEEAARQAREAEEAARAQREALEAERAAKAAFEGVDVDDLPAAPEPPPMEVAPPVVKPTTVIGARAMSYATSTVKFAVVDMAEVARTRPDLLEVRTAAANAMFRGVEDSLKDTPQHPDGGWVVNGVRFWRESGVAVR